MKNAKRRAKARKKGNDLSSHSNISGAKRYKVEDVKKTTKEIQDAHNLFVKNSKQFYKSEEGKNLITCWARDGLSIQQIAERANVSFSTMRNLIAEDPELIKAYNKGKEVIDYEVENAILKSALGYKSKEVEITTEIRGGAVVGKFIRELSFEVPPSVTACKFWLNNRQPTKWKENRNNDIEISTEDNNLQISIVREDQRFSEEENKNINKSVELVKSYEDNEED